MYIPYERRRYSNNSSPKNEGMFIINKFAGGLNNTESDALINDDQSTDNMNMSFLSGENMQKRYGTSQLLDSDIVYDIHKTVIHNELDGFLSYCVLANTNIFPYKDSELVLCISINDTTLTVNFTNNYTFENTYVYNNASGDMSIQYFQDIKQTVLLFKDESWLSIDDIVVYPESDTDLYKVIATPLYNKFYTDTDEEIIVDSPITFMSEENYTMFETDSVSGNYKNYKRLLFATDNTFYVYDMNTCKILLVYGVRGRVRGVRFNNVFFFVDGEDLYAYYDTASQMYYNDQKIEGVRKVITDPKFFIQENQVLSEQISPIDLEGNGYTSTEVTVPTWQLDVDLDILDITYTLAGETETYDVMNSYAVTGSLTKDSLVYEFDRITTNDALDSGYYVVDYTTANDTFYYWKNNTMTNSFVGYSDSVGKNVTIPIKDCITYENEIYIPRKYSKSVVYQKLNGGAVTLVDTVFGEELVNVYIKTSPVLNAWIRIIERGTINNATQKGDSTVTVYVTNSGEVAKSCNYIYVSDRPLGVSNSRIDLQTEFATVPEYAADPTCQLVLTYQTTETNEAGNKVVVWKRFEPNVEYAIDNITWSSDYTGQRRTKIITPTSGLNESFKTIVESSDGTSVLRTYIPNDISYTAGNMVITNDYVWYEPCMNELNDEQAGENFLPNKPTNISVHNGQLCVCGDTEGNNVLFMSQQANPYYFPASHTFVLESTGDGIVDFFEFDTALVVGRHNDIWVIYGEGVYSDTNAYRLSKVDAHTGFACTHCGALINNYYIYLGSDGVFYKLNTPTTYTEYLMTRPLNTDIDIKRKPLYISDKYIQTVSPIVYNNEVWFAFDGETPKVVVYSFDNMAFTYYEGMNATCLYSNDTDVYIGRKDGIITKYDKTCYSDLGRGYICKFITKRFDFDSPANFKYFKQVKLTVNAPDNTYSSIYFKAIVDSYVTEFDGAVEPIFVFGSATWGQVFSNVDIHHSQWKQLSSKGRNIQFEFYNNSVNQSMCVYEISVPYTIRDIR